MAVRRWDGSEGADEFIDFDNGALSTNDGGPITILFFWKPEETHAGGLITGISGSGQEWSIGCETDDHYYSETDFNGIDVLTVGEWQIIGYTKPNGTDDIRWHYWDDSGGWTHQDGNEEADGNTITSVRIGLVFSNRLDGLVACAGVWNSELGDAAVETAGSSSALQAWLDADPDALWAFNQSSVNDDVLDLTGNGADQTGRTGTSVVVGDDPPGFDFTLGATIEGTAVAELGFTAEATGHVTRHGTATASMGFTSTATGHVTRHGEASAEIGFTASATSATLVMGTATGELGGLTASATGHVTRHGEATAELGGLEATAKSTITIPGEAHAQFSFIATATGFRSRKPRYLLRGPTYDENLWTSDRFLIRYRLPRGITLAVDGSDVVELVYPYQEDLEQYDEVYLGGRDHKITAHEANILIAAGYGDFITPL